ncbi:hypothetical protein BZG01_12085 [Labilibaculum manganireducens]|uniref:DUF4064 domain-containing protein n=1 Tax=Labilibaculum manganireducens TaxID=1940525 RepID=A0A2N3I6Z6_9BACT|nr:hypothetical protein [Labilibaculum manganireducens]PKQ66094.1 hypothetical protein BZG01_12085 [Labilibaculum manganireducens]
MEIVDINPKQRPGLLTALCILTFIGSGFGVLKNILGMIMSPLQNLLDPEFFDNALDNVHDEYARKFVEQALEMGQKALQHIFEISLTQFILYAASLTGAILMFQLKKTGFYIYSAAQVLLLFVAPVFIGFNLFVNIGILFGSIFTILFIALYAINLNKMN